MNFDLLNHPHPHPLFFVEEGKNDGEVDSCSRCRLPLRPPAFSCSDSDCKFHVHQNCIELPLQIHNRFHPQHPLFRTTNNYHCRACWQMPSGQVYICRDCRFQIDIKCALADTKASGLRRTAGEEFRHFSHLHPLALQREQDGGSNEIVCVVCELLIKSGSSNYFCSQCNAHFHQQCAELPREMQDSDYHEHPLFLLPDIAGAKTVCNSCKNDCREFIYNCSLCNFNLHVACLQSFNHKHTFTKFRNETEFICRACGEKDKGFPWFCTTCHLSVHKKCAELPLTLRTFGHRHDLSLNYFRDGVDFVRNKIHCKICSEEMETKYAGYGCYECNYFVHLHCAPQPTAMDEFDSKDDEDEEMELQQFIHPHSLTLFPSEEVGQDRVCDGCMKRLSGPSHGCEECDFFVHKECFELPRKKRNFLSFICQHKLTLISIPDFVFQCKACLQHFHGFAYHCKTCLFTFDIRCASIKIPLNHPGHPHPLSLNRTNEDHKCEGCGEGVKNKVAFRCAECNFYLDAACGTLPLAVTHKLDPHPLNLAFVEEEETEECYCDVCEEEREPDVWFYRCRECNFGAHVDCAIGEFPYVKSKKHEGHRHPLNLAMKGKERGICCGACGESCAEQLAFECSAKCNFNVHAVGLCYHQGLVQRNLAFTNRCFKTRGIGLHQHPIQKGPTRVKHGPFGGGGGSSWEEKAFSTIKAFVVYHHKWIFSFQIQYEKNGKLVWSDKHGDDGGGFKSEVVFDYPDEYLVSISGYHYGIIRSLTLKTNRRSHGPFGEEVGTAFSFPEETKFTGLHGRSGSYLDAIGTYTVSKD